ncbi:MAG: hypothetical protein IPK23_09025 [Rhizobiales bacterium]|nr:hypothetical protein [Hyphomicrobiales bacterium]
MEVIDQKKLCRSRFCADQRLRADVARPHAAGEFRERGIGLDGDAVPALQVESERDIVDHRMPGADVDVESVFALAEAAHQVDVFEMLGV